MVKEQLSRLTLFKITTTELAHRHSKSKKSHQPIIVLGLKLHSSNNINSHNTLLRPTVRELTELARRSWNSGIIRQCIDFKGSLKNNTKTESREMQQIYCQVWFFCIYPPHSHSVLYRTAKLQPDPQSLKTSWFTLVRFG